MNFRNVIGSPILSLALSLALSFPFVAVLAAEGEKPTQTEKIYVQSVKADLKVEPKLNSDSLLSLKRGAELSVIKKEGAWLNVTSDGKTGWISKLFVNSNKPVGEAELAAELADDKSLSKASRRRSSSYSVSGATRGLNGGSRVRAGREKYPADYDAVDKIDKETVQPKDLKKFQEDGKLGQ